MKNLHLYFSDSTVKLKPDNTEETLVNLENASDFCIDAANAFTYFALPNEIVCVNERMEIETKFQWETDTLGQLVLFDFLIDCMEICAIFSQGAIIVISTMNGDIQEYPTLFEQQILGGQWSPDLSLLIVATNQKLYSITRDFEIENEVELYFQDPGREQLMTIGWGARETQFQGSAGRQKREKLDENTVPGPVSVLDDSKVLISWRGDAQYFTVSTVEKRPNPWHKEDAEKPELIEGRHLRVWNRDLELMSQCEALAGMEKSLSMRPLGNLLGVTRVLNEKRDLWLYERNGQWRSHFEVGTADKEIISIGWNSEATVLLIHLRKDKTDYVQLWTISNYDWALKIEIQKPILVAAKWDVENPKKVHLLAKDGRYDLVEIEPGYNSCDAIIISIAGKEARITDLSKAPIPPPMSQKKLSVGNSGILLFCQSDYGIAFLLADYTLVTFSLEDRKYVPLSDVKLQKSFTSIPYNLQWVNKETVSLIASDRVYSYDILTGIETVVYSSPFQLIYHQYLSSSDAWFFQTIDGQWKKFKDSETKDISINFNSPKVHRNCIVKFNDTVLIFGINHNNQVFINGNIAHQSIGSWSFGCDNFLVTSLNNQLFAMTYEQLIDILKSAPKMTAKNASYGWFNEGAGRAVERGAAVIAHESEGVRVFLQMPRGNLETIEPRFCLIPRLKKLISKRKYKEAVILMRRQRVDMNLIVDHDPYEFFENVKYFIDQIDSDELLNLFVFVLNNQDSTRTSFLPFYPERQETKSSLSNKVSKVCDAILKTILAINDVSRRHRLYTSALSCFLKQEPRIVRDAFINMKEQVAASGQCLQQTNEQFVQQKPSLFRKWIKHLKYFVKDGELFSSALQTYDLTLAYEVADEINMDPREFLPLLETLQSKTPEFYRRFHIDLYVDDYLSALKNIAQVDEKIEECILHIKQHNLYSQALLIFQKSPNYSKICQLCAEHALSQKQNDEAALLYVKAKDYEKAMKAYEAALNVAGFTAAAKKLGQDEAAIQRSLRVFALKLEQQGRFSQAAEVYKMFDAENNLPKIIENYIKAQDWGKLLDEIHMQDNSVEFEKNELKINEAVIDRYNNLSSDLNKIQENIEKYSERLEIVRSQKEKQVEEWLENEGEMDCAQSETMSEASSTASGMSNISRLSKMSVAQAKRRKNVEKKKKNIKEGSQFEDIGLLTALTEIMAKLNEIQKELATFLPILVSFDFIEDARKLQKDAQKIIKFASDKRVIIWPRFLKPKHLTGPLGEIYRCEDGIIRMPGEEMMPTRVYIENEMFPPQLDTSFSWKLKSLE